MSRADALRGVVLDATGALSGPLRVTKPVMLGQLLLADLCARFMAAHPGVTIALELTGRSVDLIEEDVDVAIVGGDLADFGLAVTPLGTSPSGLFAAPSYLERHGMPRSPRDLEEGHVLLMTGETVIPPSRPRRVVLHSSDGDGTAVPITVVPTLVSNDATPLRSAALVRLGIPVPSRGAGRGARVRRTR